MVTVLNHFKRYALLAKYLGGEQLFHEVNLARLNNLCYTAELSLERNLRDLETSFGKPMLKVGHDEVDRDCVIIMLSGTASWDDDIRVLHGWFDELHEGWLNKTVVGLQYTLNCSSAVDDVSHESTRQTDIVIGVHKDLEV